eukprot:TRINITY_DN5748_c0_g1_i1.p1 TRINITY_DN5748_c0_g1~~TRINITY_DN5748_c0_g1_i1.p1  ORF type:complete len:373 (+),score=48.22 TRINITY_DN5748_c0_g1_i1:163-1281(+)
MTDNDPDMLKDHPLFGRVWNYEELKEREDARRRPMPETKPDHWPDDTDLDRGGEWVSWLPEGWLQGIRTQQASGKTLKCYFTPEGKRFWHKTKVEEYLGYKLDVALKKEAMARDVKDPGCIPSWPEWLPEDWRVVCRQVQDHPHKCFIPPGQNEGFLFSKELVLKYLDRPGAITVTSFAESQTAQERGQIPKRRRKHGVDIVTVAAEDYEEVKWLGAAALPSAVVDGKEIANALKDAKCPTNPALTKEIVQIRRKLGERGFGDYVDMQFIFLRKDKQRSTHKLFDWISGLYYRRGDFNDRPFYQLAALSPEMALGICCRNVHLFWCQNRTCWKIAARVDDETAGFATLLEDVPLPSAAHGSWSVLNTDKLQP